MNENHFGDRVRQQLNLGLRMDDAILRRLRTGRELALERRRVANTAPIAALADNVLGRLGMPETLLPRVLLPLMLLAVGAFAINTWQQAQLAHEIEEIDAAVLTSDLPIDAYLDKGFDAWLKRSSQ